jgi:hypothetical protein
MKDSNIGSIHAAFRFKIKKTIVPKKILLAAPYEVHDWQRRSPIALLGYFLGFLAATKDALIVSAEAIVAC